MQNAQTAYIDSIRSVSLFIFDEAVSYFRTMQIAPMIFLITMSLFAISTVGIASIIGIFHFEKGTNLQLQLLLHSLIGKRSVHFDIVSIMQTFTMLSFGVYIAEVISRIIFHKRFVFGLKQVFKFILIPLFILYLLTFVLFIPTIQTTDRGSFYFIYGLFFILTVFYSGYGLLATILLNKLHNAISIWRRTPLPTTRQQPAI